MKKLFRKSLFVLAAASTVFLASCGEDESETPNRLGTAIIKGTAKANFDRRGNNPDDLEPLANATVKVSYSSADLSYTSVSSKDNYTIIKTTTTDANGDFSIEVEAKNEGDVEYTVSIDDFTSTVTFSDRTRTHLFDAISFDVNGLSTGSSTFLEFDFEDGSEVIGQATPTTTAARVK